MSDLASAPAPAAALYHRRNPYLAEIIVHESLTRAGSGKDTRHFVLSLADSGITYQPGDSLAVFARNSPRVVGELLTRLGFPADTPVKDAKGQEKTLRHALAQDYILNRASKRILTSLAERLPEGDARHKLAEIVRTPDRIGEYLHTRDYVDILADFPAVKFESPESFLCLLSPIPPRLYSIASSLAAHPGEVHLCVAVVRYDTHGRKKTGLCSGFLADHAGLRQQAIPVYVQESRHFRLPADCGRDIIMVGPGTGIAPLRAFLEQRFLDGAPGRNWLFFGEQHRSTDFLYETELLGWQKKGHLHRLDLAFSRDQQEKIYVQHRMKEHARELWTWLQNGAYFYVCGDAHRMAKDVHQTLIDIAQQEGGLTPEAAVEYVNVTLMKTERRYLRDVY